MYPLVRIVFLCFFVVIFSCENLMAGWPWEGKALITLNGESFTAEYIKHWWYNWQQEASSFPDDPKPFIEWHLLAQEARRLKLDQELAFKERLREYIKVRSLIKLKADVMDSRIDINEAKLRKRYEEIYCPRWLVKILYFYEEQNAIQAYVKLNTRALSIEKLTSRSFMEGGPYKYEEKWLRYGNVPDDWREKLNGLTDGETVLPMQTGKEFVVLKLVESKGPDDLDFERLKARIREDIEKELQEKLLADFLLQLQNRYEVSVDQELLTALTLESNSDAMLRKTLIHTNREQIPAQVLVNTLRDTQRAAGRYGIDAVTFEQRKQKALHDVLTRKLLVWEALDRHYEERPPFQWAFQYYSRLQLIKELERKILLPESKVNVEEVFHYYQQNIDQYSQPEMVSIAVIEDDKVSVGKMWEEIGRGRDFFAVARNAGDVRIRDIPVTDLDPNMRSVVARLAENEISSPVETNDHAFMIKLVHRKEAIPTPFYKVRNQVSQQLQADNLHRVKADLLRRLQARSSISVNTRGWETLKAQL